MKKPMKNSTFLEETNERTATKNTVSNKKTPSKKDEKEVAKVSTNKSQDKKFETKSGKFEILFN